MAARNYPLIPLETLQRAEQMMKSGQRWLDVASALGVGAFALRNQMDKNGLLTRYPRPKPPRRTKAQIEAARAAVPEPQGKGWDKRAANSWLKVALR